MRILKVYQTHALHGRSAPTSKIGCIAKYLRMRDHEVAILTIDYQRRWGTSSERKNDFETIFLGNLLRFHNLTLSPGVFPFCRGRLRSFDLVHIYGLYDLLGPVVARYCRKWGIPYILEMLGMYRPRVRGILKKMLYSRLLGQSLVGGSSRVIATSERERLELLQGGLPSRKVVLRRDGLDLPLFEHLPSRGAFRAAWGIEDEPLILFMGRLSFVKGLDLLLRAFSKMEGKAKLVLAGPDDRDGCLGMIQRLKGELDIGDRVILPGPLYENRKLEAFVDADAFVLPSLYESFGIVAAEAVACGLPVVLTDRCGIASLIRDRAGLEVPYDEDALRDALERILSDTFLRERLREGCSRVALELSWEEPVRQMEELYESVLSTEAHE